MAEIPVEKKSSYTWLWILLALLLAALLLWWLLDDDVDEVQPVTGGVTEQTVPVGEPANDMAAVTAGTGTQLTPETVEAANDRALQRLRNDPNATPRVYFAFDSAELTSGAQAVLRELIQRRSEAASEGVTLVGFADRAGPVPYNRELSEQRAEQVRQYLASQGVSADQIDVEAEGEQPTLVETGDGVREPLNRRVRIEMTDIE